jgi:acyl-CoA synthetase (NDP forming)/GNAT superfamily N-acetyltransferase
MDTSAADAGTAGWEGLTSDGHVVRVRAVTPADEAALGRLTADLSDRTVYLRFFSPNREAAERYLRCLARYGDADHDALLAEVGGLVVAVAGWDRTAADEAELALVVADEHQGRGIGMLLLEELRARAERCGIRRLVADTLPENRRMLDVFGSSGLHGQRRTEQGVTRSVLDTSYDDDALALVDDREAHAEQASLAGLLAPRSVAVVGAARRPDDVGHQVLRSILEGGFEGAVHAVNPHVFEVAGLSTYASVGDVPAPVDLAVVAVPVGDVLDVVGQCGRAGVRAAVVLTSGLGEVDAAGAALQHEVLAVARRYDVRLVGPNCLGVVLTDPAVRLYAWFGRARPEPGPLAVATQSGAVGISIVDRAARSGLGIAGLVSLGNKADVSGNDLLLAWWRDPRVRVVAIYLESLGNPRKFARLARRVSRTTPVLVVKGGGSAAGARAGRSHTAAAFTSDAAVDALCARAGVLRMDGVESLVDAARLLASQPVPLGGRLAVVGNGGGAGVLAADAAAAAGLELPSLPEPVRAALPAGVDNPVDLGSDAAPGVLRRTLEAVAASGSVDALLVSVTATRANDVDALLAAVGASDVGGLPVVVNVVGVPQGHPELPLARGDAAPVYPVTEAAVAALAAAVRNGRLQRTPAAPSTRPDGIDADAGAAIIAGHPDVLRTEGWLGPAAVTALLTAYGVRLVRADVSETAARARVELVVGVTRADAVGPMAMVGLGGTWTDLLQDRAFGLVPLTDDEPAALLRSLRCAPVLMGHRGTPPVDLAAVEDLLLRLSALAADLPYVAELDLNPVVAGPDGVSVRDARVRLAVPLPVPDELGRHLRA